ncbi:MAG: lysostaphin resistance A-like protein [Paenisporosarcina sp.]
MFEEMKTRHLFGLTLLSLIVAGIAAVVYSVSEAVIDIFLQLIIYVIVPVLFFSFHFRRQKISVRNVIFTTGVGPWLPSLAGLVLLSVGFSLSVFWFQLYLLMPISPGLVEFFLEPLPLPENRLYLAFTLISIAIIGPIAEEFIFRGVLLKRMMLKTSMWGGIIISSLLFGILHADIIGATLFGVVASLLYLKTSNLFVPILLHIFNNSLAVIWMYVAPDWPKWGVIESSDIYAEALPNAILLVISSIIMAWAVMRLSKGLRNRKHQVEENVIEEPLL